MSPIFVAGSVIQGTSKLLRYASPWPCASFVFRVAVKVLLTQTDPVLGI